MPQHLGLGNRSALELPDSGIQQHAGYLSRLIRLHVRTKPVRVAYDPLGQLDIAGNTIRIERQGWRVYPVYITYDVPIVHGLFV